MWCHDHIGNDTGGNSDDVVFCDDEVDGSGCDDDLGDYDDDIDDDCYW